MRIFDSDHLSFLQTRQGPRFESLVKHLNYHPPSAFFVTIISFHEQVNGWVKLIAHTKDEADLVRGHTELKHVLSTFAESQVLAFNKSATVVYSELRRNCIRVDAMGLLIATIAIANRMTLLTRNSVDFERVPNPLIDDRISP